MRIRELWKQIEKRKYHSAKIINAFLIAQNRADVVENGIADTVENRPMQFM